MPRGVYDRSKTKAQREAEKKSASHTVHAAAPKGRPGRKPGTKNKAKTTSTETFSGQSQIRQNTGGYEAFGEIRQNLMTLNMLAPHFASEALKSEVQANIEVLGNLRNQFFPKLAAIQQASTETVVGQNGVTQEYRPNVPLPAQPVQVVPPHS